MNWPIRILLVDDEHLVCAALCALLSQEEQFMVVGEADCGEHVLVKVKELSPDVIVLDLCLPDCSGIKVIEEINRYNSKIAIVVLTGYSDMHFVTFALAAGATDYLLKTQAATDLVQTIKDAYSGDSFLYPCAIRSMLHSLQYSNPRSLSHYPLTSAEQKVLERIAQGDSNMQIAQTLDISYITVRSHLSRILHKLHLKSRTQAALYAVRNGLVPFPTYLSKDSVHFCS